MNIAKLQFFKGPKSNDDHYEIELSSVVIFVGPNNSGKSLSLREIQTICQGETQDRKIIEEVTFGSLDSIDDAVSELLVYEYPHPNPREDTIYLRTFSQDRNQGVQIRRTELESWKQSDDIQAIGNQIAKLGTIRLDGKTRFNLTRNQDAKAVQEPPENYLQALYQKDENRQKIRDLTKKAFDLNFIIDPSAMRTYQIKLNQTDPPENIEKSLTNEALAYFNNSNHISTYGDGIQCFVGLFSALMSAENKIFLVDEPEAFMHPPLARLVGKEISTYVGDQRGCLLVSTHSPEFVMGCLESGLEITVIRLTYSDRTATTQRLLSEDIRKIIRDPLLRSTSVLNALFYKAAIVVEADSDRAFYEDINHKLNLVNRGFNDTLIINVHNKAEIHRVLSPLRKIGIPTVALMDLDSIKSTQTVLRDVIRTCNLAEEEKQEIYTLRDKVHGYLIPGDLYKNGGLTSLGNQEQEEMKELLEKLNQIGIFIVPNGELETWLPELGLEGHGNQWIVNYYNHLRDLIEQGEELTPTNDDIWRFLDDIAVWIDDPNRNGM